MTVEEDSIALAPDAPMWKVLRLEPVLKAEVRWTDPVPGRVTFDETRASRLGAPMSGRVQRVYIELGQHVEAGAPVVAMVSPALAELRAELTRAKVVQAAVRASLERVQKLVDTGVIPGKEYLAIKREAAEADMRRGRASSPAARTRMPSRALCLCAEGKTHPWCWRRCDNASTSCISAACPRACASSPFTTGRSW
jgi:cobalt-zinc-cadmium efflux system membrane fusion protein